MARLCRSEKGLTAARGHVPRTLHPPPFFSNG